MATSTSDESKICSVCCERLPRSEFRRRSKNSDSRMPDCRRCHAIAERDRQRHIKRKANGLAVQKFASEISRARSFARIDNLIDEMARKLCGPNNLMDFWFSEIDRLRSQPRYATRMLRFCELLLNAHNHCQTAFDRWLESASDEEYRELRQDMIRRMFLKDREVVAAAAKQAGATIVWAQKVQATST